MVHKDAHKAIVYTLDAPMICPFVKSARNSPWNITSLGEKSTRATMPFGIGPKLSEVK